MAVHVSDARRAAWRCPSCGSDRSVGYGMWPDSGPVKAQCVPCGAVSDWPPGPEPEPEPEPELTRHVETWGKPADTPNGLTVSYDGEARRWVARVQTSPYDAAVLTSESREQVVSAGRDLCFGRGDLVDFTLGPDGTLAAEPDPTVEAVAELEGLVGSDTEAIHGAADDILLGLVDPDVAAAYRRVVERHSWW